MIEPRTYDLPDASLLERLDNRRRLVTWVPDRLMVVIGNGSKTNGELNTDAIQSSGVPVYRRPTGGCSVVLSPRMLAVSMAEYGSVQIRSSIYFERLNTVLLNALRRLGVSDLRTAGTSDLAIGDKKIVGSALYRNRGMVFYHAILNLAEEPSVIERLLAVPPRMPDYRRGRSHAEFVTSVAAAGWPLEAEAVREAVAVEWRLLPEPALIREPLYSSRDQLLH